jgi:hypothetical protein
MNVELRVRSIGHKASSHRGARGLVEAIFVILYMGKGPVHPREKNFSKIIRQIRQIVFFTEIILNYLPELVTYAHVLIMKISQKIDQSTKDGKIWWSFEYFPPRTAQVGQWRQDVSMFSLPSPQGLQNLLDRIERMRALGPEFIDITW